MSANAALDAIKASLAAAFPTRTVQRSLPLDPANLPSEQLLGGVLCLVCEDGGDFANYYGREGQLGHMHVSVVTFLQVEEVDTEPADIERAELALLQELLDWTGNTGDIDPAASLLPEGWTQSKQLEYPFGWVILRLDVQF
jgi:hypothetical protein